MKLDLGYAVLGMLVLSVLSPALGSSAPVATTRVAVENVDDNSAYPNGNNFVVVASGTAYTVPTDMILVLTAVGRMSIGTGTTAAKIDSVTFVRATHDPALSNGCTMRLLPPGLSASEGQSVEAVGTSDSRIWGYLIPETL